MISGIGIDLTEVDRIAAGLKRHGERFIRKIASPSELKKAPEKEPRRSQYWAARFAAKEAFAKAFGTGFGREVPWSSVGLKKAPSGKPALEFSAALSRALRKKGITRTHVSITHTDSWASAVVILESSE